MAPLPGYERECARTVEDIKADLRHMYLTIKVTEETLDAQKRTARSLEREINRLMRSNSPISSASLSSRDTGRDTSSSSSSSYRRERPRTPAYRRHRSPSPRIRTPQSPGRRVAYRQEGSSLSKRPKTATPSCSPARRRPTASPSHKRERYKTPPRPRSPSRSPSTTSSVGLAEKLSSGEKMPPSLVGRLGLEEKALEPPTSPDPNMQMIWTVSAEEKQDLEASMEKLERVPNKAVEQKKKITSEKAGSPKTEQKAKKKDTASEKTGIPKTEQKAKKKDTASEKTGTPKTEQKAKKENTASEKVGTPKTDLRKKITACDPGGEQQDSERIIILDVL